MNAMILLGESVEVTESLFAIVERMVCHLYGMPEESDANNARYKKFCRAKIPESHQLPPARDELLQHLKRANYQLLVWKQPLSRILQSDTAGKIMREDWKLSGRSVSQHQKPCWNSPLATVGGPCVVMIANVGYYR